jgi:LacI family transcriptional regulator
MTRNSKGVSGKPRLKCHEIRRIIEETIREKSLWGQRLDDERKQAEQLGVSRWTVQAALAELEADRLIERRQGSGTYVVDKPARATRKRRERVAIVTVRPNHETVGWNYPGEIIRGALACAARMGVEVDVLAFDRPEDAARLSDLRALRAFDAFLLMTLAPPYITRDFIARLLRIRGRPVILWDDTPRDMPVTSVVDGSFDGMRAVTRHVLRLGHRRIAFLDCHDRNAVNPEKHAGYCFALREHGVDVDDGLVITPAQDVRTDLTEGSEFDQHVHQAVERLLGLPDPPTAIIGLTDVWAMAAIRALEKRGFKVGENFCVAGFGDGAIRRGLCDWLTSCRIYPRTMGEEGMRAALSSGVRAAPRRIVVQDRLQVRRSTCPEEKCRMKNGDVKPAATAVQDETKETESPQEERGG